MCVVELAGADADSVVSPSGDGCFEQVPPCAEHDGCLLATYGLPPVVLAAESQSSGDPLDSVEAQVVAAGCLDGISEMDAATARALVAPVASVREGLESGGCASASAIELTRGDAEGVEELNRFIGEIIDRCAVTGPPCSSDDACGEAPEAPLCAGGFCRPCDVAKEQYGRYCDGGLACDEASGACGMCALPEVVYDGSCLPCAEVPEPAVGADDPADEACAVAAVSEGMTALVCDRERRRCVECAEGKEQECSAGEACDFNSGQCIMQCGGDDDCAGSAGLPYCDAGQCSPCGAAVGRDAQDEVCAQADPSMPACRGDVCAQCVADNTSACDALGLECDVESNTCKCTRHAQCGDAACNLFTGSCLPDEEGAVVHVRGPTPDYDSLGDAVASFEPMEEGTIVVYPDESYDEMVVVDEGRVLAFLSAGEEPPRWGLNAGGGSQLSVIGATVLMDRIWISGNGSNRAPGVWVDGGQIWVEQGRVVRNGGGGIFAEGGAELVLRNCFVGGATEAVGIDVRSSSAEILYSTIGTSTFAAQPALNCVQPESVSLRNSIVLSQGGAESEEIRCPEATLIDTATEGTVGVYDNDPWFADFINGDFHLSEEGREVFSGIAIWRPGDPPIDIDGDMRPAATGDPDYAGADLP